VTSSGLGPTLRRQVDPRQRTRPAARVASDLGPKRHHNPSVGPGKQCRVAVRRSSRFMGHIMYFARRLQLAAAVILAALSGGAAWSQATTKITVIVPYQAGGATDVLARVLAEQIGRAQGSTMLIENRPGASTIIGTEAVSRAAPNGTTLLITDPSRSRH
jgi:hypothetical protein